ncbi:TonB-dependent receptor [Gloeobacter kilaueensis]|uniref:TonB-dependent receptor n=1 Tax=Gloeobacter kilaueensis (strain ATCC BAA-2537 / CCAP 1431/1 / ULC 316 / JS1) TaxID=1183438 RepID=U5QG75_GLOK1|nr:TonB-dependent receptor [Gloeobacter kilaueensis]AGY57921.1 TonB-dependent receptor [Gloeobacter kilaueensis JS1]
MKLYPLDWQTKLVVTVLAGTLSLAATAQASPNAKLAKLPTARFGSEGARSLLEQASVSAADLAVRPEAWNWTQPATVPRLAQGAAPAATPQTAAEPAEPAEEEGNVLDEVNVTATRRPTRARDTTATTYSIKKEDFQKQGATTVTDALVLVPGFVGQPSLGGIRNSGGNFLRGFDDQRFQVLKDGLPLQRPSNNRSDVSVIQVADLERIEVVTGGATLRYGSGAVGGVINLITETPKGPPKLTLEYQAGSYGFSRYLAKYGGGDDTFSYNLIYTGQVAFNNYPFSFTLPNSAQFYGPNDVVTGSTDPNVPDGTSLFGYLKPDVGPPIKVQGTADVAFSAIDTYTGKLVFKPDPTNKITLRLTQQNNRNSGNGPGAYAFGTCFGGVALPGTNGTIGNFGGPRFVPLDTAGRELQCTQQRYVVNTPTNLVALPYSYNTTLSGQPIPPGRADLAERTIGTIDGFQINDQSQFEAAVQWDYDITPTTSLNSFIYFYRFASNGFYQPSVYGGINTNFPLFGLGPVPSIRTADLFGDIAQPYTEGDKFVAESVLNTRFSPGGNLQVGLNITEDRSYQQKGGGTTFFDRTITRSSIFAIADISFSEELKANFGARYTYSTQFGSVGTPAVGVRYTPNNFISFRSNYSYVFNAPSLSDLFVSGQVFRPNPGLRPESGVTWDVGFDLTPAQNIGVRFTYFNTYLDGAIGTLVFRNPDTTSPIIFLQQQNNLDSRYASGIELQADWQATPQFSFRAVWSNYDVRQYGQIDNINNPAYPFFYGYQDPNIPFNQVVLTATYANKGFTATLLGRYDGGKRRTGALDFVPAWFTLDLNVELPITPFLTITGNVFNLTDTQYEYVSGVPAPGTTFRVGGRLEFGG